MTKTSDQLENIKAYLDSGKQLTKKEAGTLFQVRSLPARIKELRDVGYPVETGQAADNETYYFKSKKKKIKMRTKNIKVSENVHLGVKQYAIQVAMAGKPMNEGDIYHQAVELGLKALSSKLK